MTIPHTIDHLTDDLSMLRRMVVDNLANNRPMPIEARILARMVAHQAQVLCDWVAEPPTKDHP